MNNIITIKNLTLSFEKFTVIENLSLQIKKGQLIFITGGNGSGKTTLIKSMIGLQPIQSGTIYINGKKNTQQVISENVSYTPQFANFDRSFPITVAEIIQLECRQAEKCNAGVIGHLKEFSADKLSDKKISDLSGGELQKVMIARSLVTQTEILIFDEPTNNLDTKSITYFQKLIKKLHDNGKTIIIVTHDEHLSSHFKKAKIYKIENKKINDID